MGATSLVIEILRKTQKKNARNKNTRRNEVINAFSGSSVGSAQLGKDSVSLKTGQWKLPKLKCKGRKNEETSHTHTHTHNKQTNTTSRN